MTLASDRPESRSGASPSMNIDWKAQIVAAEFVDDRIYTIVILRDDQVERIAKRVVELLANEPGAR